MATPRSDSSPGASALSSDSSRTRPPRRAVWVIVAACVVALVAVVAVVLLASAPSSSPSGGSSSHVILAVGNYPMAADTSIHVRFQESTAFTLVGDWNAQTSRGTLTFWIVNDTEYTSFNTTGNTGGQAVLDPNATGDVALNLPLPAGSWVFLLHNYDDATVNVDVTQAVMAQA